MNRRISAPGALLVCLCAPVPQSAQTPAPGRPGGTGRLPSWLRLNSEWRGRVETSSDSGGGAPQTLYLNRLRLHAGMEARPWLRFHAEVQDARAPQWTGAETERPSDPLDLRLGYAELGHKEEGWRVRLGRQELPVADERLVDADREWDPLGFAFDAVSGGFTRGGINAQAFAGYLVAPGARRPNGFDTVGRIAGLSVEWTSGSGRRLLPIYCGEEAARRAT